ncbi:hypothetical protein T484DRAFT_1934636 [Baffinella frigidus]|nr:hypothetical protein T484DRAFT_1934636 [Cryptophyta sp. CCMP2293]|mmetsp:Transcript_65551/g.150134  ORF Transcript_65551/g.150134 Transcript_65551/m.150134 type:complete len:266 (+) Transcript_65551:35-832(+)|eukprot:CAMPEP_0180148224 /NCGR_PEP_ID=MMETSP0986-20121125/19842_1 /TAXON_ID=697907 /ORGANISM="non described non described, Strain CCMP2293" /LENGTH=265 /DNA_ID=CAMNT_0022094159 /DNA_START=18 /DNA_END=815 /DNA_ORIENTATION=-
MALKIPLFNMGRRDVAWAVMAFMVCSAAVLFVRSTQPLNPTGEHPVKSLVVILGSVLAIIFFVLSCAKIFFGYSDEDAPYQQLESGAHGGAGAGAGAARMHGQTDDLATRHLEQARRDVDSAGMVTGRSEAQPSARSSYSSRYTPREEEIDAGVHLTVEPEKFTYNGVEHAAGTFRVARVEKDGVCERQGACLQGDVIVAIGGKAIAGQPMEEVTGMLRGRPGQSIVLGIYSDQSREIINRHLVLAPNPNKVYDSARFSSASSRR